MSKPLSALGLFLALASCRPVDSAPPVEEECPAPPASAPASIPSPAEAVSALDIPEENPVAPELGVRLPSHLSASIERPGPEAGRFLNLSVEAKPYRVVISGCESAHFNGPCFATVDIRLGPKEWAELNRLWWMTSYPLSCPEAISEAPRKLSLGWRDGGIVDSYAPAFGGELTGSCDPYERIAGWLVERYDAGSR